MKTTVNTDREFAMLLGDYISDEKVLQMKNFIQHSDVDTYEHCMSVARSSYRAAQVMPVEFDTKALLVGALLHDYYLYDWHDGRKERRIHGFTHPETARMMAARDFEIGEKEQHIIRTHMWPLTLTRMPMSREAWLVCAMDKYCSTRETLSGRIRRIFGK